MISSPFNSVVPLFNPIHNVVRLTKGTVVGVVNIYNKFARAELQNHVDFSVVLTSVNTASPHSGVDAVWVTKSTLHSADADQRLHNDHGAASV